MRKREAHSQANMSNFFYSTCVTRTRFTFSLLQHSRNSSFAGFRLHILNNHRRQSLCVARMFCGSAWFCASCNACCLLASRNPSFGCLTIQAMFRSSGVISRTFCYFGLSAATPASDTRPCIQRKSRTCSAVSHCTSKLCNHSLNL